MWNVVLAEFPAEGIFWILVVIVTMIARAVRAAKEAGPKPAGTNRSPGQPAAPATPRSAREPSEELQEFLESLTGARSAPRPPPPPPPPARAQNRQTPVARPTPPRVRRELVDRQEVSREVRRPGYTQPPSPQARRVAAARAARAASKAEPERTHAARLRREHIIRMLKEPNTLRDAIVLREVIGPPTALR